MTSLSLHITKHPDKRSASQYDSLVGIDLQKADLLDHLMLLLDPSKLDAWVKEHHGGSLPLADRLKSRSPLVILAGEVGCGKTALATSVGSPLAAALGAQVLSLETPSDIRGSGLVGELSSRVTAAFDQARSEVTDRKRGLLIIDEGDDLGASRSQMQAHHEDRAGLNVLIKQIDRLGKESSRFAVVLITNRLQALDPALIRRGHVIQFTRPSRDARVALFQNILAGTGLTKSQIEGLADRTESTPAFSYSDIISRIAEPALRSAYRSGTPLTLDHLLQCVEQAVPTPLIE